jgi:hypothetical protein
MRVSFSRKLRDSLHELFVGRPDLPREEFKLDPDDDP